MKLDTKKLIDTAVEFIFDRKRSIYIRRRHFSSPKAWNIRNESGEYLNSSLDFEHEAGQRLSPHFRERTEFTIEVAFQLASEYVGKTVRDAIENRAESEVKVRKPGVTNFNIYTNDDE